MFPRACYRRCFVLGLGAGLARAEDGLWTTDFAAAQAKAKAEKKLLLVDFTGSDWCAGARSSMPKFSTRMPFKAMPQAIRARRVGLSPRRKLPDDLKAQNKKLAKEYKVHGFPTVLLLDAEGSHREIPAISPTAR